MKLNFFFLHFMSYLNSPLGEIETVRASSFFCFPFIFLCTIYKCQDLLWKNNHVTPPNPKSYSSLSLSLVIQLGDRANLFQFVRVVQGTLQSIHQVVSSWETYVSVIFSKHQKIWRICFKEIVTPHKTRQFFISD